MDKAYELKYHEQEEQNWWFVARRDIILRQLKDLKAPPGAKILDIGSSGGALSLQLAEAGYTQVYSLDYSEEAIQLCKKRGLVNAFVMDGHAPDFPEESFDIIISSDCLEHLEHDQLALSNWLRILKTGGTAIIYVPAFMFLWSQHDVVNLHYRRYTRKELVKKLTHAGFTILKSGFWNFSVFFPTAIVRLFLKIKSKKKPAPINEGDQDQLLALPHWLNSLLIRWLKIENQFLSYVSFPIGVSTFAIVKK